MTDNNKTYVKTNQGKQAEGFAVVVTIMQALALSGCNKVESDMVVTRLIQGLQTGVLDGSNFRSVLQYAPRLTQAMADGLNIKHRELRKMGRCGELTTDIVVKAIESQFNVINSEFKELPMSLGGDKPTNQSPVAARILAGLCVGAVVMVFSLTNCSPAKAKGYVLQGNDIALQGNDFSTPYYGNGINAKLPLAKYKDNGYDGVLSKNNSGRANRSYLAFYVTDSNMDSQIHTNQSDTAHECFKREWGSTPLFMVADGRAPTPYEGKTSLNKIAFGRISGAVAIVAESDSSHPISLSYSVIPTQKTIGAIHHG